MKKNTIIILSVVVVALVVVYAVWESKKTTVVPSGRETGNENAVKVSDEVRVQNEDSASVLSAFPEGFPAEPEALSGEGAKLIPAGSTEQQSTIEYGSTKSLSQNADIFRKYIADAGFTIMNEIIEADEVFLYSKNDTDDMSITIRSQDGMVTVKAKYLKR